MHWADLVVVAAIVAAGAAGSYLLAVAKTCRMLAQSHREMDRRLAALTETLRMHATETSDGPADTDALSATEIDLRSAANLEAVPGSASLPVNGARYRAPAGDQDTQAEAEIPPEIAVAIAVAAVAVLGKHARVRSARRVPPSDVVSPWTHQGRVIVQSSHNLRSRG